MASHAGELSPDATARPTDPTADPAAAPAVRVRNLHRSFNRSGGVLNGLDLDIAPGEFVALIGRSGSGKSTLLRALAGLDRGVDGYGQVQVPASVSVVFQDSRLLPWKRVLDNVVFGLHRQGIRGEAARKRVAETLEMVHLTGLEQRRPKQLSGGQQQRVALARAIVTKPRVLLLDEPLSALDRRLRQDMQIELRRIQRESGLTTIFVTHDQEEALTLSDTVAILDRGRIVHEGVSRDLLNSPDILAGLMGVGARA